MFMVLTTSGTGSAYKIIDFINPNGERVFLKWGPRNMPVPWFYNNTPPNDFSLDAAVNATRTSYDTWEAVETSGITFQFGGTTNAEPLVFFDSLNTLGFAENPFGPGVLAATDFLVFTFTGEIAESDIFFNVDVPWSVAPNGEAGHFDYQSVATHEIGHFLGLSHSGVGVMETRGGRRSLVEGSSILYPIAYPPGTTIGRTLTLDDIVGASVNYPAGNFSGNTATMSGRVTKNGEGLEAAHLTAYNPFTDELIGIFTDANGDYTVQGLSSGPTVVRVNPIIDPASPGDFGFSEFATDLDYEVTFHEGRAEVTAGTTTRGIDVAVTP
jgi:hypothetical protein